MHHREGRSDGSGSGLWINFHVRSEGPVPLRGAPVASSEATVVSDWAVPEGLHFADTAYTAVYTLSVSRGLLTGGAAGPISLAARSKFPRPTGFHGRPGPIPARSGFADASR